MEASRQKNIILGITGGIAAYKSAELLRLLVKQGFSVQVVMTEAACRFITPVTMQALSGAPVLTDQWDSAANGMAHIVRHADAIVVAPATADFMAKLAQGLAGDLLSTVCLARDCPLLLAPAMNKQMWENAATQRNVNQLLEDGITLLGPACGEQACGEVGMGRMWEAEALSAHIAAFFQPKRLNGVRILLTAGPTYEAIDAVRGITNRSSGKMGYAIARVAQEMGAIVTLVSGPTGLPLPEGVNTIRVSSAAEMFDAVKSFVSEAEVFIGVAAVADYRVAQVSEQKIKKSSESRVLQLVPNPDILAYVAALPDAPFCVGFAAESERLHEYARAKRAAKKLPLLVANLAREAIGADENEVILFDDSGEHPLPRADKLTVARHLLTHLAEMLAAR